MKGILSSRQGFSSTLVVYWTAMVITVGVFVGASTVAFKKDFKRRTDAEALHQLNRIASEKAAQLIKTRILVGDESGNVALRPPSGEPLAQFYRWYMGREPQENELPLKLAALISGEKSQIELEEEIRLEARAQLGELMGGDAAVNVRALYRTLTGNYPTSEELVDALQFLGTSLDPTGLPLLAEQVANLHHVNRFDVASLYLEVAQEYQNEFFYAFGILNSQSPAEIVRADALAIASGSLAIAKVRAILLGYDSGGWNWVELLGLRLHYFLLTGGECGQNASAIARAVLGPLASPQGLTGEKRVLTLSGGYYDPVLQEFVPDPDSSGIRWVSRGPNQDVSQNGCDLHWIASKLNQQAPLGANARFEMAALGAPSRILTSFCDPASAIVGECPSRAKIDAELTFGSIQADSLGRKVVQASVSSRFVERNLAATDAISILLPSDNASSLLLEAREDSSSNFSSAPITVDPLFNSGELEWTAPADASDCIITPSNYSVANSGTENLSNPSLSPLQDTVYVLTCTALDGSILVSNGVTVNVVSAPPTPTPVPTPTPTITPDPCDPTNPLCMITFETVPGVGVPTDGTLIKDQYLASHGVRFFRSDEQNIGGGKILPAAENPIELRVPATWPSNVADVLCDTMNAWSPPAPGEHFCPAGNIAGYFRLGQSTDFGTRFLFDPAGNSGAIVPIWVQYSAPVSQLSGFVIDIDEYETVQVIARDALGTEVGRKTLSWTSPDAGDGMGTYFSFQHASNDISMIEITADDPGFGFDNFSPSKVCTPPPLPPPPPSCDPTAPNGLITFETVGGVAPTLATRVYDQFKATHGVTFKLCQPSNNCVLTATPPADCVVMADSAAYMAEIDGPTQEAFQCDNGLGGCSQPADGYRGVNTMGRFFITDEQSNSCPKGLVIDYDFPVDQASFGVIDIDGPEKWQIKTYDAAGTQVGSTTNLYYGNGTFDGKETRVEINRNGGNDISRIVLIPYNHGTFGLGFDNFSPSKVCP